MKKLIILLSLIPCFSFALTGNSYWGVINGGTLPSWNILVNLQKFSANTLGWGINDYPGVVSYPPATNGLMIVRGGGSSVPSGSSCGTKIGEGYTCGRTVTGSYNVAFTVAFQDAPSCTCSTMETGFPGICVAGNPPITTAFSAQIWEPSSSPTAIDLEWNFICVGQRNTSD